MKIKGILIGFMLVTLVVNAQKQAPCAVTMNGGNTIEGYIKRFNVTYNMGPGFILFKNKKQKMQIVPTAIKKVLVNDTITYYSLLDKNGNKRLMKEVLKDETSLYLNAIRITGNIPGEGMSIWFNNDFYLKRANKLVFIDEEDVLENPEVYFPNAPKLCSKISTTKKKGLNILKLVKAYNKMTL